MPSACAELRRGPVLQTAQAARPARCPPAFIPISNGKQHDVNLLELLSFKPAAFYMMGRGEVDFAQLDALHQASAFFVTRAQSCMDTRPAHSAATEHSTGINSDPRVLPNGHDSAKKSPEHHTMNNTLPFETLFELSDHSDFSLFWLALGGGVLLLSLAGLWRAHRRGQALVLAGFFVVASLVATAASALAIWDGQRLVTALKAGQTQVVQGPVLSHSVKATASYNGNTKRYDRRVWESFLVGEVAFGFDRKAPMPGFTNSAEPPVELADGDLLRIHFVEDVAGEYASRRILRVERMVRKPD